MFSASKFLDFGLYSLLCTFLGGIYNDNHCCYDDDDYESQVYSTGYGGIGGSKLPNLALRGQFSRTWDDPRAKMVISNVCMSVLLK